MNHSKAETTVVDPVCGMQIDPASAVGSSRYRDETYYFCSRGCEAKFDGAPAQFAAGAAVEAAGCCRSESCC